MSSRDPKPRQVYHCICGDHVWTPLSKGYVTFVSPEDAHFLFMRAYTAKVTKRGVYAFYTANGATTRTSVYLARQIMRTSEWVDHRDGNPLDNRRCNIREANQATNVYNRAKRRDATQSKYKGVCRKRNRWQAACKVGEYTRTGVFDTEIEAAEAYEKWSKDLHKEYASSRV